MSYLAYFDVIIIGSGLAGLYAANQIQRLAPTKTILILEKNNKHAIGGRAGNDMFYGTELAIGAGVGRKHKDHNLIQLLKQCKGKVHTSEFEASREYITPFQPVDINKTMKLLRSKYNSNPAMYKSLRFKDFFIKVLNEDAYQQFVITSGYTDYERADTYETLYKYGMDDNTRGGWTAIHVSWRELVNTLYNNIGKDNFKFSSEVTKVVQVMTQPWTEFQVSTLGSDKPFYCNKIVVATTISGVKKILQTLHSTNKLCNTRIYDQIHGQPFLMVYAKFDKKSSDFMKARVKTFTVVSTRIQKLIPMNPDKGVYMIAYTDNSHAASLKGYLENTPTNCTAFSNWVEEALGITGANLRIIAIKSYYWSEGTHYYDPLILGECSSRNDFIHKVQNPCSSVAVVGEAVSRNQGWVEGALESVNAVITKEWLNKHNYIYNYTGLW